MTVMNFSKKSEKIFSANTKCFLLVNHGKIDFTTLKEMKMALR